jgi:hypothetical protein
MHWSTCREGLLVPGQDCSCLVPASAACHARMPATDSGTMTFLGFLTYP